MSDQVLEAQAREAGVDVVVKACPVCSGEGRLSRADPLDLKRLRERHVSLASFAASVWNPTRKKRGVSVGFISMVESEKSNRRCPDWLLSEYLAIPDKTWPARPTAATNSNEAMQKARAAKGGKR